MPNAVTPIMPAKTAVPRVRRISAPAPFAITSGRSLTRAASTAASNREAPSCWRSRAVAFSPDFLKLDPDADPMGALTTKIPMERPIVKIPARTDKNHTTSVAGGLVLSRAYDSPDKAESHEHAQETHNKRWNANNKQALPGGACSNQKTGTECQTCS